MDKPVCIDSCGNIRLMQVFEENISKNWWWIEIGKTRASKLYGKKFPAQRNFERIIHSPLAGISGEEYAMGQAALEKMYEEEHA